MFPMLDPTMNKTAYAGQQVKVDDLMKTAQKRSLLIVHSCNANSDSQMLQSPAKGTRTFTSSAVVVVPPGSAASASKEFPLLEKFMEFMEKGMDKFDAIEAAIDFLHKTPAYANNPAQNFVIHYFEN